MIRRWSHVVVTASTPVNRQPYRPNFWAENVAYPTAEHKKLIWAAMQLAMRIPDSPTGGERP